MKNNNFIPKLQNQKAFVEIEKSKEKFPYALLKQRPELQNRPVFQLQYLFGNNLTNNKAIKEKFQNSSLLFLRPERGSGTWD
jgi:hypothetical protein